VNPRLARQLSFNQDDVRFRSDNDSSKPDRRAYALNRQPQAVELELMGEILETGQWGERSSNQSSDGDGDLPQKALAKEKHDDQILDEWRFIGIKGFCVDAMRLTTKV